MAYVLGSIAGVYVLALTLCIAAARAERKAARHAQSTRNTRSAA